MYLYIIGKVVSVCSPGSKELFCMTGGLVSCCFGWKVVSSMIGEVSSSVKRFRLASALLHDWWHDVTVLCDY